MKLIVFRFEPSTYNATQAYYCRRLRSLDLLRDSKEWGSYSIARHRLFVGMAVSSGGAYSRC